MNTLSRAVGALTAAALAVPLWAPPAFADTTTETALAAAYFNSAGVSQPPGVPQAPPNLITSVDGVEEGKLAVASQAGREDKVSFLFFGLSEVPAEATIDKAVLTVPLVPADNANVSFNVDPALVTACKIIGSGFSSEDGTDLALAPERDCAGFAVAATAEGTNLVFDITALATSWAEVNDGLALTRTPGSTTAFQAVLSREASLAVEYTAPSTDTGTTTDGLDPGAVTTDLGGSTGGTGDASLGGGSFSGGTSDTFGSGSSSLGSLGGSLSSPIAASAPSSDVLAPETAGEQPVVAAPVSSPSALGSSSPTAGFWLAALLLGGVLALLSLILGDPRAPVAGPQVTSRLAQALSARQRGTGTSALSSSSA